MSIYGYIRVSSYDQNEDRQLIAMRQVGVPCRNIFLDKQSGKDFDRTNYKRLVKKLRQGDVLYIKSIDRLGRNYDEILEQWRFLTRIKKIDIVVIEMPLLDTRKGKDLIGSFISDVILQVLSFVAENERKCIRSRQREGIEAAKARGVMFGRPPCPIPDNFMEIYERWKKGEITASKAADECGFCRTTFYCKVNKIEKEKMISKNRSDAPNKKRVPIGSRYIKILWLSHARPRIKSSQRLPVTIFF